MVPKSISWITPAVPAMNVEITNGWMPQINRHYSFSNYYTFTVAAEDVECPRIVFQGDIKTPEIWPPTGTPRFPKLNPEPPFSGTPISHLWDPTPIRSFDVSTEIFPINGGDSIALYRVMDTIDVPALQAGLNSASDYVMLRIQVLKSSDSSYLYTVDSIIITSTNARLPGSAPDIDVDYATLKIPSGAPSDSAFIAIRMDRAEFNGLTRGVSQILSDSETLISAKRATGQIQKSEQVGFLKLSVQPNPFMNATLVTVRTIEGTPTVIELSDVSGRMIQRLYDGAADREEMHLVIEGSELTSGTYFVRVVSGGEVQTRKIQLLK
jgi:hypothetical protein